MKQILYIIFFVFCMESVHAQKRENWTQEIENYTKSNAYENAKNYLDDRTFPQPIEGIWQSSDGFISFIRKSYENGELQTDKFIMIVLESSTDGWNKGQIQAFINFGNIDNVYTMKYYTIEHEEWRGYKMYSQQTMLFYENDAILTFQRIDTKEKVTLFRQYPSIDNIENIGGLYNEEEPQQWSGSGIAIAPNYVATNFHVVDGAKTLNITNVNNDKNRNYFVEIVAIDKINDLAVLKVSDERFKGFNAINYGLSTVVMDLGKEVFVLGYPLIKTMGEDLKITNGIISAKTGFQGDVSLYQISAPIQPGNSGGPLFDYSGNLIGIVNAKHAGAENVGYAIKLSYLQNLIESSNLPIELNKKSDIDKLSLSEKIIKISPNVVCIKANVSENKNKVNIQTNLSPKASDIAKAEQLFNSSRNSYNNKQYSRAFEQSKKSLELFTSFGANYILCLSAIQLNDKSTSRNSLNILKQLLDDSHNNYIFNFLVGLCCAEIGEYEESIKYYMKILKFENKIENIDYPTLFNNLAYSYLEMDDIENAKTYIETAISKRTIENFIWDTDGEYAYKTGDYERCINSMNNAIAISKLKGEEQSEMCNSYKYRGLAHLQLGDTIGAYYDFLHTTNDSISTALLLEIGAKDTTNITKKKCIIKPYFKTKSDKALSIDSITITNEYTILNMTSRGYDYDPYMRKEYYDWYSIDEHTYLYDKTTNKKYPILHSDNCSFSHMGRTTIPYSEWGKKYHFTLYFQRIPDDVTTIDFIEPNTGWKWQFFGIKLNQKK